MQRRRTICASPRRTTSQAWSELTGLIVRTLERSDSIDAAEVETALAPLDQLGRMLVSAGHLENDPLTLVAGDLWLELFTLSGTAALDRDENLNLVPGAAGATDWTLYVPQVEPTAKLTRATVKGQPHLSADEPVAVAKEAARTSLLDLDALALWAQEDDR